MKNAWDDRKECVGVDLSETSLLKVFDGHDRKEKPRYRVMDYDHGLTEECQSGGRHLYIISRQILESDVVISLPKLKTHEKVGITCGLKGLSGSLVAKTVLLIIGTEGQTREETSIPFHPLSDCGSLGCTIR